MADSRQLREHGSCAQRPGEADLVPTAGLNICYADLKATLDALPSRSGAPRKSS